MWNDLKMRVAAVMVARANREEGQALVEYGLILGLVSVVSIAALTLLGGNIEAILNELAEKV
jgi:pilus assembly protein Flp/PilA